MPIERNLEVINRTRVTGLMLGPCAMCGRRLRKVNHHGPWIPGRMHQKCWKQETHERAERDYRIITLEREAVFTRAMNGDTTVAFKEGMEQKLADMREKYVASDINLEDPAQMKQFHADALDFSFPDARF